MKGHIFLYSTLFFEFHYNANYRKYELKFDFFQFYFLNIGISGSMHDTGLKLCVCALMILLEGSMSQIFY